MKRFITTCLFLVLASSAFAQSKQEAPQVTGRVDAAGAAVILNELNIENYPDVLILATVLQNGRPLSGLTAEDFRVREDEVNQEPLTVEPKLPPLSVVVALDSSGSMAQRVAETREAAKLFVDSLGAGDSAQALRFARDIETMTPMTSDKATVRAAIDAVTARGDTALYDALYQSVELLADRPGRRAVVLLSDGIDDDGTGRPLSEKTVNDVLARAGAVGVPVFTIGLGAEMDEVVLSQIAETTGALYLNAPDASELAGVYGQISAQLTGQYAIRYRSSLPADGSERRVDLVALSVQDSKTYRANGNAETGSIASGAAAGSCKPVEAMQAEVPGLQQANDRYDRSLITVTDRDAVRRDAVLRIDKGLDASPPMGLACIRTVLEETDALYDEGLITVTDRDDIRDQLEARLAEACTREAAAEPYLVCLRFFRDAYEDGIISVTTRDQLRADLFDRLVDLYTADLATDEALAEVNDLYEESLISVTERNDGRQKLLSAEGN